MPTTPTATTRHRQLLLRPVACGEISDAAREQLAVALKDAPKDSPVRSTWIQLARAGKWRGHPQGEDIEFDESVYKEIVANFARNLNGEVPLDFEHASEEGSRWGISAVGAPAQGWIKELRYDAQDLEGRVEWVVDGLGAGYVARKAYKYISPAVIFDSVDRVTGRAIGAELTSAALTNRPFLEGMRPVEARHGRPDEEATTMADKRPRTECGACGKASRPGARCSLCGTKMSAVPPAGDRAPDAPRAPASTSSDIVVPGPPNATMSEGDGGAEGGGDDEDPAAEGGDEMTADQKKNASELSFTKSAQAADRRSTAMSSVNYTDLIRAIYEELAETFGWSAYVVACFDDHVIFETGNGRGKLWSVPYTYEAGGEAKLGDAVAVRVEYVTKARAASSAKETATMSEKTPVTATEKPGKIEGAATLLRSTLGIPENATDVETHQAVVRMGAEVQQLKGRAEGYASLCKAMNLPDGATEGEAAKRLVELTAAEKRLKEVEPEVVLLRDVKLKAETAAAGGEVDFIIQHGERYKLSVGASSRNALLLQRKHDPEGFATEYKAALDGMRANDDPKMFGAVTRPGSQMAGPPPERSERSRFDDPVGDDASQAGNDAFEAAVDAEVAEAKAAGTTLMRSDAMSRAHQKMLSAVRS